MILPLIHLYAVASLTIRLDCTLLDAAMLCVISKGLQVVMNVCNTAVPFMRSKWLICLLNA
jgi:Na+/alanine symporter